MAIVTEQTLPFSTSDLDLQNPIRWRRLLPLMRPSLQSVPGEGNTAILVDRNLAKSKDIAIAMIADAGRISSTLLQRSFLSAIALQDPRSRSLEAQSLVKTLSSHGVGPEAGFVVIQIGQKLEFEKVREGHAETALIKVASELQLEHLLALLTAASHTAKASFKETSQFLQAFVSTASSTTSIFQSSKSNNRASIQHAGGVAEFQSAHEAIKEDMDRILNHLNVHGILAVHYADINGLARSEHHVLAHDIAAYLQKKGVPYRVSQSSVTNTASHHRGWGISACSIPEMLIDSQIRASNALNADRGEKPHPASSKRSKGQLSFNDQEVRRRVQSGCEAVIAEEPRITEYDTIVGDGDCGYTLRDGSKEVMRLIEELDLEDLGTSLSILVDDLQVNMGGTSGALYCIFLSQLAQTLDEASSLVEAVDLALKHLMKFTKARLGDRTMLDCLIPFVDTWKSSGDPQAALQAAHKGVEGTQKMQAKLGRSTYLDDSATQGVPDPGAYGLYVLLKGMVQ